MLSLGLGGGRPPAAPPAAPATARLVGITTAAKVQHQERDRSRGVGAAAPRLGNHPARDGGMRSCGITTARARTAQGAVAALAGPVNRPQLLHRGRVLAAPAGGPPGRRPAGRTGSRTTAGRRWRR